MTGVVELLGKYPIVDLMVCVIVVCTMVLLLALVILGRKFSLKLGKIHAQFSPNGGDSMKDSLMRIEKVQRQHSQRLAKLEKPLIAISDAVTTTPSPVRKKQS